MEQAITLKNSPVLGCCRAVRLLNGFIIVQCGSVAASINQTGDPWLEWGCGDSLSAFSGRTNVSRRGNTCSTKFPGQGGVSPNAENKNLGLALTENRNVIVTWSYLPKMGSVKLYHPAWKRVQAASPLSEESCAQLYFCMCTNAYNRLMKWWNDLLYVVCFGSPGSSGFVIVPGRLRHRLRQMKQSLELISCSI